MQTYNEITSDKYLDYIKPYVVGIGPWKDTIVPVSNNRLTTPTDLVARAHSRNLQVCLCVRLKTYFSCLYDHWFVGRCILTHTVTRTSFCIRGFIKMRIWSMIIGSTRLVLMVCSLTSLEVSTISRS